MNETHFMRHTAAVAIDAKSREKLYNDRKLFIHFPEFRDGLRETDNPSLDPTKHDDRGRLVLERLIVLGLMGGYVCAEYYGYPGWIVGKVEPGTRVERFKGKWHGIDRVGIYKTLQLTKAKHLNEGEGASLLTARPRQGSLMQWFRAGRSVIRLVDELDEVLGFDDLSPNQQEVLCSEFLRLPEASTLGLPNLAHLFFPTGRTMRDIDILGIATDGKRLVAQVTRAIPREVQHKLERLLPFRESSHTIMFCETDEIQLDKGVHVVPIRLAYETFMNSSLGTNWLQRAFGK